MNVSETLPPVRLRLASGTEGARLDRFLAVRPELGLTRTRVQALIASGRVTVGGRVPRAAERLSGPCVVQVEPVAVAPSALSPEAIPLRVLYEDADLAVLDKPAGLVVHPGAGVRTGTLAHALLHRFPELARLGGERPGIVHRLDRGTSGAIAVARTPDALALLSDLVARRAMFRTYLALVRGRPPVSAGRIEAPIGRSRAHRTRMAVVRGGKHAATRFRVRVAGARASLLELDLETGRTHQIRVHLAHAGHAVLGDPTYGPRAAPPVWLRALAPSRPMLHAWRLAFAHPRTGRLLRVEAPVPEDFHAVCAALALPVVGGRRR